ncbi:SDR family NAD(P)-dependent oxidoreductase [Burkholderia sp. 22PA0099]|uniref:SDR family NAD(P)-dependent oxidoreductase n=1 Tax=Burkholderia sp. 22PA0099 TaxID=3237372 RepID=UPI0039C3C543
MSKDLGVWFVTGSGRGLGLEIAKEVLQRGGCVVAAARNPDMVVEAFRQHPDYAGRLLPLQIDLSSESSVTLAIQTAIARFGRIDTLVNNAGYGLLGAIEEASDEEVEAIFHVNVFGTLRLTRAALPELRGHGGHVINVSSLGGFAASAGWGIYNATKFAVEGLSEALALEGAAMGVKVMIVEPGSFRTGFLSNGSMQSTRRVLAEYETSAGKTRSVAQQRAGNQAGDPAAAARLIVDATCSAAPPLRLVIGEDAIHRIEGKLRQVQADIDAWRQQSVQTAFE